MSILSSAEKNYCLRNIRSRVLHVRSATNNIDSLTSKKICPCHSSENILKIHLNKIRSNKN